MEATSLVHFHSSSLLEGLLRPHPTATKRPTQMQATLDVAARNFSPTNLLPHPLSRNTVTRSPPHGLKPHSLLISSSQSHSGAQNSKNNNHNLISITNHLRRLIHSRAMPGGEFLYASPSSPPYTNSDANNLIQNNNHNPRNLIQNNNHNPNPNATFAEDEAWVWTEIKAEARRDAEAEPALASYLYSTILCHSSLERSLSFHLGNKLCSSTLLSTLLYDLFLNALSSDASIRAATVADLRAARLRDPACISFSHCLLNYKGFLACQAHRVAHKLWSEQRRPLALALHSRVSDVFSVDIHPAAKIGKGILFDHATGVVIGETAVIGNNCSILHHVTLGGTGKIGGDRHPKVGDGVLIGAGATILGNVRIGEGAKIGAGSVVLIDVPPRTTAVGNPARLVGGKEKPAQNEDVPGESMDHTSFISEWSDYII